MSLNAKSKLVPVAKEICRGLRKNQTRAERIFWDAVRDRRLMGRKFYRQFPLFFDELGRETFFIADFYCHEVKLAIEIDGKIHDRQRTRDELRTELINNLGVQVLRFQNDQIEKDLNGVLKKLKDFLSLS